MVKAPEPWSISSKHRSLTLEGAWDERITEVWAREGLTRFGWLTMGASLGPHLAELPGLRQLSIIGTCEDDEAVMDCLELEGLTLHSTGRRPLDLRGLLHLRDLDINERLNPDHLAGMLLRSLRAMNWQATTLAPALACASLRELQLDGARRVRSFNPDLIDTGLTSLQVSYGRGLIDLVGLDHLCDLVGLHLERVRPTSFSPIGALRNLRELGLVGCGDIPDLGFTAELKRLRDIAVADSNVVDGDLTWLDDLPSIEHRYVTPRKHYNRLYVDTVQA